MDYIFHYNSPLGGMTLASDGEALIGLWFEGQKHYGSSLDSNYIKKELPVFEWTKRWLDIYFSGNIPGFTPPLYMRGTDFQKKVWEALLRIPFGQTTTYGEIADRLGNKSARAIGSAVAHNPIGIIIPCHRVLDANGNLHGYAAGIDKKEWLLALERSNTDRLRI